MTILDALTERMITFTCDNRPFAVTFIIMLALLSAGVICGWIARGITEEQGNEPRRARAKAKIRPMEEDFDCYDAWDDIDARDRRHRNGKNHFA